MNPLHHPPESHLVAFVTGNADPSLRALVECHAAACESCSAMIGELSAPGGQLIANCDANPLSADLFARILQHLPTSRPTTPLPLPEVVKAYLPPAESMLWRGALKPGFRFMHLLEDAATGVRLYLVHLSKGVQFPHHTHAGLEESVILSGGIEDGGVRMEAGDWSLTDSGVHHSPKALDDEDCWLIARMEGEIRFSGWRGLLQKI
jgi:putative transcriptional regulator